MLTHCVLGYIQNLVKAPNRLLIWILILNLIPMLHVLSLAAIFYFGALNKIGWVTLLLLEFAAIYLVPPLLYRTLMGLSRSRRGKFPALSPEFIQWWAGAQLQVLFLRFSFFEEFLRIFPFVYSAWLRLWGAKIGKNVYWSPKVMLMDRGMIEVGNAVVIGAGVGISSHYVDAENFVTAAPKIGNHAILGGMSLVAAGAEVGTHELLPASYALAPFYKWENGRKTAPVKISSKDQ
jgi:hypothetical protein